MRTPLLRLALLLAAIQYPEGGAQDVCEQCADPTPLPCVAAEGCVAGGTPSEGVTGGAKQCKKLTCNSGRFITDPKQTTEVTELECKEDAGASGWVFGNTPITQATCVEKVSCATIGHLKSDCTGLKEFEKCDKIDLTKDDDKLACKVSSDKMFFKPKAGTWAEETAEIKCELFRGVWKRGTVDVAEDDSVICAEYKYKSCETNAALNLKSDCAGAPKCSKATFADASPSTCTAPQKLYIKEAGGWAERASVTCDRKEGKWKDDSGAEVVAGTNVVCSEAIPAAGPPPTNVLCTTAGIPISTCGGPSPALSTPACSTVSFSDTTATTCAAGSKMYINIGGNWAEKPKVECDTSTGIWKDGASGTVAAGTNVVCSKLNPAGGSPPTLSCITTAKKLTSDCDATVKTAADCEPISAFTDDNDVTCTAPKDLHVKVGSKWVKKPKVKCDTSEGKWKDDAGNVVVDASNVICYHGDPNIPPCGSGCVEFDASAVYDCKATEGCVTVAGAETIADVGTCKEMTCKDSGFFVDLTGTRIPSDKLSCSADDKWEMVDTSGTVTVVASALCVEKFECQTKNPLSTTPKADGTEVCPGCKTVDFNAPTCAAGEKFYHKPSGGAWAEAEKISCDIHSGKWMQTPPTLPSGDPSPAVAMTAGDVVVCAATEPPKDPCTACGAVAPSTICDAPISGGTAPCTASTTNQLPTVTAATDGSGCLQIKCETVTDMLFINDATVLAAGEAIKCDGVNKWKDKDGAEITKAVCVEKIDCQAGSPLKSSCDAVKSTCDVVDQAMLDANDVLTCTTTPTHVLYTQPAAGGAWTKQPAVWCDPAKGHWQTGDAPQATNAASLDKDAHVICAPPDTQPVIKMSCPALNFDCDPGLEADPIGCVPVTDKTATIHACPQLTNPVNLYFKYKTEHYQQAKSVKCDDVTGKWTVKYNYGALKDQNGVLKELEKELELNDRVVCAKRNPEPAVCRLITSSTKRINDVQFNVQQYKPAGDTNPSLPVEPSRGAGDMLVCELHQLSISSTLSVAPLTQNVNPVCSQSGKWEQPVPAGNAYFDFGDQATCAAKHCNDKCDVPPSSITITNGVPYIPHVQPRFYVEAQKSNGGSCAVIRCKNPPQHFAIKDENDAYFFFSGENGGQVRCEGENVWKVYATGDVRKKVQDVIVKQIECVQQLQCLSNDFLKATIPPCPTGDKYTAAGCVQLTNADVHPSSLDENYDRVSCPDGKKLFVQKKEVVGGKETAYWYEVEGMPPPKTPGTNEDPKPTRDIKCDTTTGTWNAKLVSEGPFPIESDPANSFFCADSNPDVAPTTTTTTTTEAPLGKICDLCRANLPNIPEDFNTTAELAPDTPDGPGDACVMKAKDKFQLLVGSNNQKVEALMCTREDPSAWYVRKCVDVVNANGTKSENCTITGALIGEFKSQLIPKNKDLPPLAYVVIAVALAAVGGMGIGCVMIYLRMRKDLSEKEKKKERGVTKKYTTANVMKTSGKSSGGRSELGKSKEPTKSKMEENDDAPTLKL